MEVKLAYPWTTAEGHPFDFLVERVGTGMLPQGYERILVETYLPMAYEDFLAMDPGSQKSAIRDLFKGAKKDANIMASPHPEDEFKTMDVQDARKHMGALLTALTSFGGELALTLQEKDPDKAKHVMELSDFMRSKSPEVPAMASWIMSQCKFVKG